MISAHMVKGVRKMSKFYEFEYVEIGNCEQCPLFYDYTYCLLEDMHTTDRHGYADTLDDDGNFLDHRPDWCRLKERKVLR